MAAPCGRVAHWNDLLQQAKLSVRPAVGPSHFSLRAQREVTKRKGTRGSCSAHSVSAVPCVARNPAAGANSHIPVLEHARLSLPDCCATRPEQRGVARGKPSQGRMPRFATTRLRSEAAARMAASWGPCRSAGGWRNSPQGRAHDARVFFASTRRCCRKTPQAERELAGQDARRAAGLGWPFSWLLLFGHTKRSNSGRPQVGLKASLIKAGRSNARRTRMAQRNALAPVKLSSAAAAARVNPRKDARPLFMPQ